MATINTFRDAVIESGKVLGVVLVIIGVIVAIIGVVGLFCWAVSTYINLVSPIFGMTLAAITGSGLAILIFWLLSAISMYVVRD